MVRWRRVALVAGAVLVVLLLVAAAVLRHVVTGIAKDNLSNREFWREHQQTPWSLGLASSNVTIASDGLELAGWWIPGGPGNLTAILVHGLGSNMSKPLLQWAPNLHGAGLNVLTFDLRNHGASGDTADHRVTYGVDESRDVQAAVAYVRANAAQLGADPGRIVLYGGSMGAATALLAAAKHPPGVVGVLADSGFASFAFQAHIDGDEQGYPRPIVDWVLARMDDLAHAPPTGSRADKALAQVTVPVLLAHCTDDERVQFASYERLRAIAPDAATWTGSCASGTHADHHVDGYLMPGYNETVRAFLAGI